MRTPRDSSEGIDDQAENSTEGEVPQGLPSDVEELAQRASESIAVELSREMFASSWQGRLPRPDHLKEYEEIVPGIARQLADELLEEGNRFDRAIELDREVSSRVLTILEKDSESDREFRHYVFNRLTPAFYLPFVLVSIVLFLPMGDLAKFGIVGLILLASIGPICIALLKGRMTATESDAIKTAVPQIVSAVREAMSSASSADKMDAGNHLSDQESTKKIGPAHPQE